jgi:hypothetical protein
MNIEERIHGHGMINRYLAYTPEGIPSRSTLHPGVTPPKHIF